MNRKPKEQCLACGVVLTVNNKEIHHFPVPKCCGGEKTVPLCRGCHDMVDRINIEDWPLSWSLGGIMKLWDLMDRDGRLFMMKLISIFHNHLKRE